MRSDDTRTRTELVRHLFCGSVLKILLKRSFRHHRSDLQIQTLFCQLQNIELRACVLMLFYLLRYAILIEVCMFGSRFQ